MRNIFTYLQGLQEIISNIKPKSMTEERRLTLAKQHLKEARRSARKMQNELQILQERLQILEESLMRIHNGWCSGPYGPSFRFRVGKSGSDLLEFFEKAKTFVEKQRRWSSQDRRRKCVL